MPVKITYLSHAMFELSNSKTLLIDPYFSGNPYAPSYTKTPDFILVTHEHFDHADVKQFTCPVVAPPTVRAANLITMKIGDKREIDGIIVEMIGAHHPQSRYPTGYVITIEGKRIAHLGDTYLEGVKPLENIDVLLIPIGGTYTMNIDEAVKALEIIKPKLAIPMHYNTFPEIRADPQEFKRKAEVKGFKVVVLKVGESYTLE